METQLRPTEILLKALTVSTTGSTILLDLIEEKRTVIRNIGFEDVS